MDFGQIGNSLDLLFKVAQEQDATISVGDVRALASETSRFKTGKLTLANITLPEAIKDLEAAIRTESLILQLIQNKDDGEQNFAEIKALMGTLG